MMICHGVCKYCFATCNFWFLKQALYYEKNICDIGYMQNFIIPQTKSLQELQNNFYFLYFSRLDQSQYPCFIQAHIFFLYVQIFIPLLFSHLLFFFLFYDQRWLDYKNVFQFINNSYSALSHLILLSNLQAFVQM